MPGVLKVGDKVPPAVLLKSGDAKICPLRPVAGVCIRVDEVAEEITGAFPSDIVLNYSIKLYIVLLALSRQMYLVFQRLI